MQASEWIREVIVRLIAHRDDGGFTTHSCRVALRTCRVQIQAMSLSNLDCKRMHDGCRLRSSAVGWGSHDLAPQSGCKLRAGRVVCAYERHFACCCGDVKHCAMAWEQSNESFAAVCVRVGSLDETCTLQHVEVMRQKCRRKLELLDEFTRCAVGPRQLLGNLQTARVTEGSKDLGTTLKAASLGGHASTLGLSNKVERLYAVNFR